MNRMKFPIKRIFLHTAAFRGPASVEVIDGWHREKGYEEGGYHWVITGSIFDKVMPGIYKARSLEYQGAHVRFHNNSIGICVTGHGDHLEWTENQMHMVGGLCQKLMHTYNIPLKNVLGHREIWTERVNWKKTCPGLLIDMKEVRKFIQGAFITDYNLYRVYQ